VLDNEMVLINNSVPLKTPYSESKELSILLGVLDILEFLFQLHSIFDGVALGVVVEIDVDGMHFFGLVLEPFGPVL
jgi:hypothetical protein